MTANSLAQSIDTLRERAATWVETVAALPAVCARRHEIDPLLEDIRAHRPVQSSGLIVCLVGSTGAGKSTLINALAGSPIAREGVDRPTTSEPTVYAPDDAEPDSFSLAEGAKVVRYRANGEASWSGHVFIDAPDVNSLATSHREATRVLAEAADVLLVVMHHQSVAEASPVAFLDAFRDRRHLVFVLGRCDELSETSRERVVAQIRMLKRERWGEQDAPVFAVSAKAAQSDPQGGGEFPRLVDYLHAIEGEASATRLRRDSLLGATTRLAEVFAEIASESDEELGAFEGDLDNLMTLIRARFEDYIDQRLSAYGDDAESLVRAELGRQWSGPSAMVLRMSALSRAGLGLAGLLARRNPLLSGVAITAAEVLERRSQAQQSAQLANDGMWDDLDDRVRAWCRAEQVPFVSRASRLNIQVPDIAEVFSPALIGQLDHDWGQGLLAEFPATVRRALPRPARTALDLPLYGLAFWLVARACYGLVADDPVSVDWIFNAGIVASAWVGCSVWVARWRTRVASREILERQRVAFLGAFDRAGNAEKERVLAPVSSVRSALTHLQRPWLSER